MSCLSLTNLTGSAAVQPLPLPTAEIWRGVWRCLAQSQGIESTSTSIWLATSRRRNQTLPQAAAKETSCAHILSHMICTPNPVISTVPFIPKAPCWVGRRRSSACSVGVEEQRTGLTIPSPPAGQGGHPGFFGTWFCLLGLLHLLQPPPYDIPAAPSLPQCVPKALAPKAPPTLPPAVSSLPATLLLPGLSSGLSSCLFWKHFLK